MTMQGIRPEAIERELERLLGTPAMRGSRRSQEFLRYVVKTALRGEAESLKERTLGVALFQRLPDYDTSEDAIVRVKANEVRRRLAKAYQDEHESEVEISLPPGSYVPEFRSVRDAEPSVVLGTQRGRRLVWWGVAGAIALILVLASGGWYAVAVRAQQPSHAFWEPILETGRGARISVATGGGPDSVGAGDMITASTVAGFLGRQRKPFTIVVSDELDRSQPGVHIGAAEVAGGRYVVRRVDGQNLIEDITVRGRRWGSAGAGKDYALISRIRSSAGSSSRLLNSGVGRFGAAAAAELLTDQEQLTTVLRSLPAGWEKKDVQMVVEVDVRGGKAGSARVIATHVW